MYILLKDGTTETMLVAGSGRAIGSPVGPMNLRIAGSVSAQVIPRLRATEVEVELRGNLQSAISFGAAYEFATEYDAQMFCATHAADLPRTGSLRIGITDSNNAVIVTEIPSVVITSVDPVLSGVGVDVSYTATGGKAKRIET